MGQCLWGRCLPDPKWKIVCQDRCTYGMEYKIDPPGMKYKMRSDCQEQLDEGTSPGLCDHPHCHHICPWEEVPSTTRSSKGTSPGQRKLPICPKGWAAHLESW